MQIEPTVQNLKTSFPAVYEGVFSAGVAEGKKQNGGASTQEREAIAAAERQRLQEINDLRAIGPEASTVVDNMLWTGASKANVSLKIIESGAANGTETAFVEAAERVGAQRRGDAA